MTDSTVKVEIHRSQFPDRLRAELADCLRLRRINHKFHYESHKQVRRWLSLHEAHSPARTDIGVERIYENAFEAIAAELSEAKSIQVISLGSGGGRKDASLLGRLAEGGVAISYTPLDVSVGLALTSRETALPHVSAERIRPLVCDLATVDDWGSILHVGDENADRRVFLFFGMLPNFEPSEIMGRFNGLVREDDLLLCSANLAPGEDYESGVQRILPQYDNEATRSWLATLPNDLGLEVEPDDIVFSIAQCDDERSVRRIEAAIALQDAARIQIGDEQVTFEAGETLRLFFSCRYTPGLLEEMMNKRGLGIRRQWISDSGEEGVFQCGRLGKGMQAEE